ncbi:Phox-like protein [Dichomitus squalens LYAD-421 SS1]|uniref:Endosomal/vacuolar adapter protein YPT35 n=2 Tax=Dichomitus squalens TaxID=114155 RepID=A0A4Q9MSL2_9APHY|nr:Phox-like protein [Dichomitus squalens LYAD-421 SS1]EJF60580.1 Phox-like protein [Dichomitus squalens LYAD-421 SS1]TBU30098.1 Phox-like protein [Dichomitus squalens]
MISTPSSPSHSAESSTSFSRQPSDGSDSKGLLVLIPDRIDIEEEAQFYDDISASTTGQDIYPFGQPDSPPLSPVEARSIFSNDIWLGDNSGESKAFARGVEIPGWTSVGDKRGGAYVVYDCAIRTKEGTVIHALKRYSAFAQLYARLRATLPASQQPFIPSLPPKFPLAKFRPTFLDRRRRLLQHWLSAVLLHPEIGGCQAVREWVVDRS